MPWWRPGQQVNALQLISGPIKLSAETHRYGIEGGSAPGSSYTDFAIGAALTIDS